LDHYLALQKGLSGFLIITSKLYKRDLLVNDIMAIDPASDLRPATTAPFNEKHESNIETLGHLRLRDAVTNDIILVPTPSADPHDPLNW
jgi:hypothetical protein